MTNIYMTTGMKLKPDANSVNIHAWSMSIGSVREFGRDGFPITAINFSQEMIDLVSDLLGQQIEGESQNVIQLEPDDIIIVAHFVPMPGSTDEYTVEFTGMKQVP